jgi:hypothetical protein
MTAFAALTVTHVILATAGFAGLIATNVWLLALCRTGEAAMVTAALRTWRGLMRLFGPLLGAGVLAGFALALAIGQSLAAAWLIATYGLILVMMAVQAAVMVPWQLNASATLARGGAVSTRSVAIVLSTSCVAYAAIVTLMLLRP